MYTEVPAFKGHPFCGILSLILLTSVKSHRDEFSRYLLKSWHEFFLNLGILSPIVAVFCYIEGIKILALTSQTLCLVKLEDYTAFWQSSWSILQPGGRFTNNSESLNKELTNLVSDGFVNEHFILPFHKTAR